jgi:hypothetical protein
MLLGAFAGVADRRLGWFTPSKPGAIAANIAKLPELLSKI